MRHQDGAVRSTPIWRHASGESGVGGVKPPSGQRRAALRCFPGRSASPRALLRGLGRLLALLATVLVLSCCGLSQVDTGKGPAEVIVYTRAGCPYCALAKQYLADHGVAYQEYDVFKSEKGSRDYKALGGIGVPIFIVGNKRMDGYDEARLTALLKSEGVLKR